MHAVLGLKEPQELGVVLPHEHMLLNFDSAVTKPDYGKETLASLSLDDVKNLGMIRYFP